MIVKTCQTKRNNNKLKNRMNKLFRDIQEITDDLSIKELPAKIPEEMKVELHEDGSTPYSETGRSILFPEDIIHEPLQSRRITLINKGMSCCTYWKDEVCAQPENDH